MSVFHQHVMKPVSSHRQSLMLLATSLGFAVVQLDVSIVNVAIKSIGASLGGGVSALQWVVSTYTLLFAACILTAGALGDRIGAKRVFIGGFALFTIASICCGAAPNLSTLIAARAVQGIGAAALVPCSLTILNHAYNTTKERSHAIGLWAAGASVALAGGPLIGGLVIASLSWRAIFFINVPIGAVGIWLAQKYADETSRSSTRNIDPYGQAAAIICLVTLAWSTITGGEHGFTRGSILVGYATSLLALGAFIILEKRQKNPMLPLRLFQSSIFSVMTIIGLFINIGFYGLIFVLSLFFQQAQHLSALRTGLAFAPMTAIVLIGNLSASKIVSAIGEQWTIRCGLFLVAAGCARLLGLQTATPYIALALQLLAIGMGLGLIVPVMTTSLLGTVPKSLSGVASGVLNTARQTGSVMGVALFGALIARGQLSDNIHKVLIVLIVLMMASTIATIYVRSTTTDSRSAS